MRIAVLDSGQKIVSSGLILNLDAGQLRSYSGTGTTWNDISGNAYNATMSNLSFASGAMTFNGTNSAVTVPVPKPTMPLSIEFWINPDTSTPRGVFDTGPSTQNTLRQYSDSQNDGSAEWWNSNPWLSLGLSATTWQHVVLVYRFTTVRVLEYYRNGSFITSATGTNVSTFSWSNPIRLGDINSGSQGRYAGKMAIFRVYQGDLGATGSLQNYNAIKSRFGL